MTRRLIGWRVRWEQWGNGWTGWEPRDVTWLVDAGRSDTTARMFARCAQTALTDSNGTRRIRVLRVFKRSKR